jgi:GT2 family glycosyltransferase
VNELIRIGTRALPSIGSADRSVPVSFVVPTYNAAGTIEACIAAIRAGAPAGSEVIVVDDGSLDDTVTLARRIADTVICRPCQGGAARARNDGATVARGVVLFFIDADVVANAAAIDGALTRIAEGADAVFGAYQPLPPEGFRNAPTTYKNLLHHWTHLRGAGVAGTFWSGFGALRRDAFFAAHGFDPAVTTSADVEDIHLGYRLSAAGFRIVLDPSLQVAHHKRYTVRRMIASDVFHRAIPWVRAMLELRTFRRDLNLRQGAMSTAGLAYGAPLCFAAYPFVGWPMLAAGGLLLAVWLAWNRDFLGYARRHWGLPGAAFSAAFIYLYYLYGPLGVVLGSVKYVLRHDHASFLNRLSLAGGSPNGSQRVDVTVAVILMPGEPADALAGLPELEAWWELIVVGSAAPQSMPAGARFIAVPATAERNEMRALALQSCRGEMLATLDGSCVPQAGWLERVRAAANRSEFVVGGAFEHDRRSIRDRAYQVTRYFAWRPERAPAWLVDHPSTNAAFRTDVARQLGGFADGGALVLRMAGFGARPVRFDPAMRVRLTGGTSLGPLTRGIAGVTRLRAAATCRYFDIKTLHRIGIVLFAPIGVGLLFGRAVRRSVSEGSSDARFWLGLPLVALGLMFAGLGRIVGIVRPGSRGGVVPQSDEEVAALGETPAGARGA